MVKKICTKCDKPSYSSYSGGKWICPYCNEDLSGLPFYPSGATDEEIKNTIERG